MESCVFLCIVVLGGVGSIPGIIQAGVVLIAVPEVFRELQTYRMLAFGLAMATMMVPFVNRKLVSSLPVRARTCLRASHRQAQAGLPNFYFPISPFGGIFDPVVGIYASLRQVSSRERIPIFLTQILDFTLF